MPLPDLTKPLAFSTPEGQSFSISSSTAERSGNGQRTLAYAAAGVGVIGVGIGSFFGLRAISKNKDAESLCRNGYVCEDPQGPVLADDARAAARISTITFVVGGAALAGAAVLYFTSPKQPAVTAAVGPTGISVRGSFQ